MLERLQHDQQLQAGEHDPGCDETGGWGVGVGGTGVAWSYLLRQQFGASRAGLVMALSELWGNCLDPRWR